MAEDKERIAKNATPPSLYDLLAEIKRSLSDLRSEVLALRIAQKKAPAVATPGGLSELIAGLTAYINGYFATHNTPIHLHKVTRLFGRRFTRAGTTSFDIVREPELLRELQVLYSDSGAIMLLPRTGWDAADEAVQQTWIASSDSELHDIRSTYREALVDSDEAPSSAEETLRAKRLKTLTGASSEDKRKGEGTQS